MQYPHLRPMSEYDLTFDPIHRYSVLGHSTVSIEGYDTPFELAAHTPAHLWPHNARKIGMIRYIPTRYDSAIPWREDRVEEDKLHAAFQYT